MLRIVTDPRTPGTPARAAGAADSFAAAQTAQTIPTIQAAQPAQAVEAADREEAATAALSAIDYRFAGQIATSVWLGYLTDPAAREALLSYAIAKRLCQRGKLLRLRDALLAEYELCRERQDLVS